MDTHHHALILGGTGRTGGRVLTQLLDRGVPVRAIVRPGARLPGSAAGNPLLDVVPADLLALPPEVMARHLDDCDTVISCLGHSHTGRGTFGPPLDLVEQAVRNVWAAVSTAQPTAPVRVILMTGASVNQPGHADTRRGRGERAFLGGLRTVMPPARTTSAPRTSWPTTSVRRTPPRVGHRATEHPDRGRLASTGSTTNLSHCCPHRTTPGWPTSPTSCASWSPTTRFGSGGAAGCL